MSHNIMNNIIPFDDNYKFALLEDIDLKNSHPVSNYFLKLNDLSINLLINLKWILWGYTFLYSLSENLKKIEDCSLQILIEDSLQAKKIKNFEKDEHILLIDNNKVSSKEDLAKLIKTFYNEDYFDQNTKIHLKLKINLDEFLLIKNYLYPTLIKIKYIDILNNKK